LLEWWYFSLLVSTGFGLEGGISPVSTLAKGTAAAEIVAGTPWLVVVVALVVVYLERQLERKSG